MKTYKRTMVKRGVDGNDIVESFTVTEFDTLEEANETLGSHHLLRIINKDSEQFITNIAKRTLEDRARVIKRKVWDNID